MQTVTNDSYVRSRTRRGNIANFGSMGLLAVGFLLSLLYENLGRTNALYGQIAIFVAYGCMIGAFLLLSYGRTFTRRWGPRFRQDQWLIPALRTADNRYTLFNYPGSELPDHILLGPGGLFVLVPKPNGGTVRFDGNKWSRGDVKSSVIRFLAEGTLGDPFADVRIAMTKLATYLRKHGPEELIEGLEARPVIVFTNPGVNLQVRNAPLPVMHSKDLKTVVRRAKPILSPEKVEELKKVLGREVVES